MTYVFGADPGLGYVCRARLDGCHLKLGHALLNHRSIWSGWLYWLGLDVGHTCSLEPLSPCLYGEWGGLVFGIISRFVPSTWWSVRLISLFVF